MSGTVLSMLHELSDCILPNLGGWWQHYSYFAVEEAEAQGDEITCLSDAVVCLQSPNPYALRKLLLLQTKTIAEDSGGAPNPRVGYFKPSLQDPKVLHGGMGPGLRG